MMFLSMFLWHKVAVAIQKRNMEQCWIHGLHSCMGVVIVMMNDSTVCIVHTLYGDSDSNEYYHIVAFG